MAKENRMRSISIPQVHLPDGFNLVAIKPYSDTAGDEFISVVAATDGKQFVTWEYNWNDNGCFSGRYLDSVASMLMDFGQRPGRAQEVK